MQQTGAKKPQVHLKEVRFDLREDVFGVGQRIASTTKSATIATMLRMVPTHDERTS